jgi:hypothetical protein
MRTMESEPNPTDEARPLDRPSTGPTAATRSVLTRALATGFALTLLAVGGYVILRCLPTNGAAHGLPDDGISSNDHDPLRRPILFAGWGKPDLAIVISGQMHGYMLPCGCSDPQYGGLIRRMTFIDELKAKGWPVVGVDLGELAADPKNGIQRQRELKLEYSMKALDVMGYKAVGLGKHEMIMPLTDALAQYSLDHPSPRPVSSTLMDTEKKNDRFYEMNVRPYEIIPGPHRVGVLSLTGPDLQKLIGNQPGNPQFFDNGNVVLPKVTNAFAKEKVEFVILMHHEYPPGATLQMDNTRRELAQLVAHAWEAQRKSAARKNVAVPPLHLIMRLTEEPEPPAMLQAVKDTPTHIVEIGHKGKYVGVLGVFRNAKPGAFDLKYELVRMEPSYHPRPGQKNAVLDVLQEYAERVMKEDLLAQAVRTPHPIQLDAWVQKTYGGSRFLGSDACQSCHPNEYNVWAAGANGAKGHAQAFDTLVKKAKDPTHRQFDPECVICHTVGFKHSEGYNELPLKKLQNLKGAPPAKIKAELVKHNAKLAQVGCENCHGPCSAHAANPKDAKVRELINPYRPSDKEKAHVKAMNMAANAAVRNQAAQDAKALFDARMGRLSDFCRKCHDDENDVNWFKVPFLQHWVGGQVVHNRPDNVGNIWIQQFQAARPAAANVQRKD